LPVRAIEVIGRGMTTVAGLLVVVLILLGVWDVASREFGLPFMPGAGDLPALVLAAIACLTWPRVQALGGHVATGAVVDRLPTQVAMAAQVVGYIVATVAVGWFVVASWQRAMKSLDIGETTIGADRLAVWPVRVLLAATLVVLLLQMLVTVVNHVAALRNGERVAS